MVFALNSAEDEVLHAVEVARDDLPALSGLGVREEDADLDNWVLVVVVDGLVNEELP